MSAFAGHGADAFGANRAATRMSSSPPTATRAAPTVAGDASGPRACAVPVVPNRTAERRTRTRAFVIVIGALFNNL